MKALNASRTKWFVIGAILLCAILAPHRCLAGISIGEIYGSLSLDSAWPPQGEGSPCWSPDGTTIVFSWGDGYTAWDPSLGGYPNPDGSYIVIMTADGQAIRGPDNPLVNDPYWDNGMPDWSPDGNWIVYIKSRVGPAQILKVPSTGGDAVPITQIDGNWHPRGPKWSPDGTKIAYRGGDYWTMPNGRPYHIWITDPDGSSHEDLTPGITGYGVTGPSWSPDGTRIVFTQEGEPGLLVLNVTTKSVTTLPGFPSGLTPSTPVWASDNSILFNSTGGIYDYQIDTQTTTQLTFGPDGLGDWHPTSGLVFSSSRGCTVMWDSNIWTSAPRVTLVEIDIKPGSYPNAINLGSQGLIPVAILSSPEFDATSVDPDTVELAGSSVSMRGKSNKYMAHEEDVNGDNLLDLVVQVATENLDPDSFQDGYAILTGKTYGGEAIEGWDEITIVPPE
ncbi:MAG TPA: hypothetical protein VMW72_05690 [Sedimentisphaerales bacterium]|nr:hypothetical protein [Sedimentisphaerales bacterium]